MSAPINITIDDTEVGQKLAKIFNGSIQIVRVHCDGTTRFYLIVPVDLLSEPVNTTDE